MSKRKLILILIAIVIALISTLVRVNATDYKVLNQGDSQACMVYAVETYIDVIGATSCIGAEKAISDLGEDATDPLKVLDYYVSQGAIDSYKSLTRIRTSDFPILAITWVNEWDWVDATITEKIYNYNILHASVLLSRESGYLYGINSWGDAWGFNGHYKLYNTKAITYAYILTVPEAVIWN